VFHNREGRTSPTALAAQLTHYEGRPFERRLLLIGWADKKEHPSWIRKSILAWTYIKQAERMWTAAQLTTGEPDRELRRIRGLLAERLACSTASGNSGERESRDMAPIPLRRALRARP